MRDPKNPEPRFRLVLEDLTLNEVAFFGLCVTQLENNKFHEKWKDSRKLNKKQRRTAHGS